jgi:hypothetical protein
VISGIVSRSGMDSRGARRARIALERCCAGVLLALALAGCHSSASDQSAHAATFIACQSDDDCPQPARVCQACFDGGEVCARSQCGSPFGLEFVDGEWKTVVCNGVACPARRCVDSPGWCPGSESDPCAGKSCGDACQQCNTADGGCYAGTCNARGACKASVPDCSSDSRQQLAASCSQTSDAVGTGDCNYLFGFAWTGSACEPVVGCSCVGSDCYHLFSIYCAELAGCIPAGEDASCAAHIPNTCFRLDAGTEGG